MTFGDLSLNGTVHVIPSLLEETSTDPPSVMTDLKTTVDDSVNVAMGELEKKIEDLEKENEDSNLNCDKNWEKTCEDLKKENCKF